VRRLSTLSKILLLVVCFSLMLFANGIPYAGDAVGCIIDDYLLIPYVDDPPVVDGSLDAEWDFPRIGMRTYTTNHDPALPAGGAADLSAWYQVAWNEDGLYFYGEVIDDSVIAVDISDEHVSDSWEIFLDGDNSKGPSYDDNDIQFRWIYDADAETKYGIVDEELMWAETDNGYALELSLPASSLADSFGVVLEAGKIIGWETQVNDAEVEGTRQNQIKWWSDDDRAWNSPSYFGTAYLSFAYIDDKILGIEYVENPPIIDGHLDADWADPWHVRKIAVPVATTNNTPNFADGGYKDLSAFYYVASDADGLYFYGQVTDDSVVIVDDPASDQHNSDSWEIFIDGDNSKGTEYDSNDVQFRWIYDYTYETKHGIPGEEVVWAETDDGYALELLIPASYLVDSLDIPREELSEIGWEVQVNDAEVDGVRQNQIKWWNEDDRAWQSPSYFGTAGLFIASIPEPDAHNIELSVPFILNANTNISYVIPDRSTVKLNIYNMAGQAVKTLYKGVIDAGPHTLYFNASSLSNGVYLCRLEAGGNATAKKVMVIK
jgi:hypothetical protein